MIYIYCAVKIIIKAADTWSMKR